MAIATTAHPPTPDRATLSEKVHGAHEGPPPPADCGVPREKRRAIVVGASSGIGAAIARQLVHEGYHVAALARRAEQLRTLAEECAPLARSNGGALRVHVHDVHETGEVPTLLERAARELGGVFLLVYAAAVMPETGRDEYDTEKDLDQIAVNLSGCIAWCNVAASLFRTQRDGTIVGISSIAGDRGRKGNPAYGTTKAAMNTYLEALRNRLAESGVHVCTIKPGFVDTAMTKGKKTFWMISAEEAARLTLDAARRRANVRYVPRRWWLVGTVIRAIPSFLFRHLNV
jgi:NAD(P)-dependent dehydrogenase (short-subunit alcohol dehydrogenase family)